MPEPKRLHLTQMYHDGPRLRQKSCFKRCVRIAWIRVARKWNFHAAHRLSRWGDSQLVWPSAQDPKCLTLIYVLSQVPMEAANVKAKSIFPIGEVAAAISQNN